MMEGKLSSEEIDALEFCIMILEHLKGIAHCFTFSKDREAAVTATKIKKVLANKINVLRMLIIRLRSG